MVKVFVGSNFYLIKRYIDKIKSNFIVKNGEMSLEEVDCGDIEPENLINKLQASNLFSEKKLIIARDISQNKKLAEHIEQILSAVENTNDLIIVERDIDKRGVYYKFLKNNSDFTQCDEPNDRQLTSWLQKEAKDLGADISRADAGYMVSRIGLNQQLLYNELKKLTDYDKNITKKTIDELTVEKAQSSIFNLIDAAFSGNSEATLRIYEDQKAQGSQPQSIFGMVVWQANMIAIVAAASNLASGELSASTGLKPFSISKADRIYKKIGRDGVDNLLDRLVEIDKQMKTRTSDADELLKNLLVTIS